MVTIVLMVLPSLSLAKNACPTLPLLPYDLDPTIFKHIDCDPGPLSDLKFIPLSPDEEIFLSIGGEARVRFEIDSNPGFGAEPEDGDGVFLDRYALATDLHIGPHVRIYSELASAFVEGKLDGPGPVDENALEFQNLFLELRNEAEPELNTYFRAGRQELQYGAGRLVSVRDGPNVRRTFDGAKLGLFNHDWDVEGFFFRPREDKPGSFDDSTSDIETLWGIYAKLLKAPSIPGQVDFFYFGFDDEEGFFDQGLAEETRHTLGTRLHGHQGAWDWNWEAMAQFGTFGEGDIFAWTLATDTGYTFHDALWKPRFAVNANIASGDEDPSDPDLETFNPLFPRGNYFSEAAILGPRNFFNAHFFLTLHPTEKLTVTTDFNSFYRLDTDDGVYAPSGSLIAAGDGSNARFVGSSVSVNAEYEINRNLLFTGIYTHFAPGDVLEDTSPGESIDFFEATLRFRF